MEFPRTHRLEDVGGGMVYIEITLGVGYQSGQHGPKGTEGADVRTSTAVYQLSRAIGLEERLP
jgi:hypothetical protein